MALSIKQLEQRRAAGRARARGFTRDHQQRAGRRGAEVTMTRYGRDFLLDKVREWQLTHPSRAEKCAMSILDQLDVSYARQVKVGGYLVDLGDPDLRWGIEVRGQWIHDTYDSPEREAERTATITAEGFHLLVVADTALVDAKGRPAVDPSAMQAIREFVAVYAAPRAPEMWDDDESDWETVDA